MNKYIWAHCPIDVWPYIRNIMAKSYNDAVEKLVIQYGNELEDDYIITSIEDWKQLKEYLNDNYSIALSDLELYEEI